jgi:hypothetical protein
MPPRALCARHVEFESGREHVHLSPARRLMKHFDLDQMGREFECARSSLTPYMTHPFSDPKRPVMDAAMMWHNIVWYHHKSAVFQTTGWVEAGKHVDLTLRRGPESNRFCAAELRFDEKTAEMFAPLHTVSISPFYFLGSGLRIPDGQACAANRLYEPSAYETERIRQQFRLDSDTLPAAPPMTNPDEDAAVLDVQTCIAHALRKLDAAWSRTYKCWLRPRVPHPITTEYSNTRWDVAQVTARRRGVVREGLSNVMADLAVHFVHTPTCLVVCITDIDAQWTPPLSSDTEAPDA